MALIAKLFSACWRYKPGFLAKLNGEGRPFSEKAHIDLSSKPFILYRGDISDFESVHLHLSILPVGIKNTKAVLKTNQ